MLAMCFAGSGVGAAILASIRDAFPARYIVTTSTAADSEGEVPCQAYVPE